MIVSANAIAKYLLCPIICIFAENTIANIMIRPVHFLSASILAVFMCGCASEASTVGFLTDPLESECWDSSIWISAADAPVFDGIVVDGSRAADGSSWFVSTVANEGKVVSAKWMTTGLGVFELYLNGKLVGEEILKPGFTHYAKTKISFTYDVTDAMDRVSGAENVFSAQLTPGWWGDKIVTPAGTQGMIGKKCAFRAVLQLIYDDGTTRYYGTDLDHWLAGIAGPVTHAAIFDGENYDARELSGYECMEKLSVPEENTEFAGEIVPTCGAEIYLRRDLTLDPVLAYNWQGVTGASEDEYGKVVITKEYRSGEEMVIRPGEVLVVDFGQNCSAVPEFEFKAAEGTVLSCLPAELLNDGNGAWSRGMDGPEGSCHRRNLRIPDEGMYLNYTFDDSRSYVKFLPRCTFFGYRYVSVTATDEVRIRSIRSIPVSSMTKELETGNITTGNDLINRLISNTLWGQRSNYLSVTTDCPQRNERLGWTADTQVFAETGTFFANTAPFFHKWTRDLRDTQSPKGGFPGVAPAAQYGSESGSMMRLGWSDAGVIVPWTVWKQFGDLAIIEENWGAMEKYIDHVAETKYDHNALIAENDNFQWGDWLSYEPLESCSGSIRQDFESAVDYWNYLSASYWLIDAGMMRDMAAASGRDAGKYEDMVDEARNYIRTRFFNEEGLFNTQVLNTMQTPALFALRNGILEGERRDAMIQRLRENFAAHDNCLQTGFLGTSILMQTLTDNGMADIAYELLFQRKNPSWLYSVDNGATTIWERWNSYMLDSGMGPSGMNSFNHYAYGCVCEWIWETVAGISADVADPGFRHIIMKPVPDRRLGFVNAEYRSAAGLVKSAWEYEGERWIWRFTIPEGSSATVWVPGEEEPREFPAGSYTID